MVEKLYNGLFRKPYGRAHMSYRVKLRSAGFELEIEGDRDFVESKLADLSWLLQPAAISQL